MPRLISACGLCVMVLLAWGMSSHRTKISLRIVVWGVLLQFLFALFVLKTSAGRVLFDGVGNVFTAVIAAGRASYPLMFGLPGPEGATATAASNPSSLTGLAFTVLPAIIFFSSLMSVLYFLGVMQLIVRLAARAMQATLGTSGAESLAAAANIFLGQTEAPLVVRPYLPSMTRSELMAVMVGGFASIAGSVLAAYVSMGIDAGHLVTASVISAPAGLLIAKILEPEVGRPVTLGRSSVELPPAGVNLFDAAAQGAADGLKLALNVGAMLIAFLGLLALVDILLKWAGLHFGQEWSVGQGLGYVFCPFAWIMGIEAQDCLASGRILGIRIAANEFIAYQQLADLAKPESTVHLAPRTRIILTYALCGFANFGSIGVQIGGIGGLVEERRADLAILGLRAMLGGMLACFMTACVAGILL